jgi:hypothetical protein
MTIITISHKTKEAIDALLEIGVPLIEAYRVLGVYNQKNAA